MSNSLESVKDTIREHPTETAAVIAGVAVLCGIFYYSRNQKRIAETQARIARYNRTPRISWLARYFEYRTAKLELQLRQLTAA